LFVACNEAKLHEVIATCFVKLVFGGTLCLYKMNYLRDLKPWILDVSKQLAIGGILTWLSVKLFSMYLGKSLPSSKMSIHPLIEERLRENCKISRWWSIQSVLNKCETFILQDVVTPDEVEASFEDIGGLEEVKSRLNEALILPLTLPTNVRLGKLFCVPQGILLYGPPGTGKTMLAKAIAKSRHAIFINLNPASLNHYYYGETEKVVEALFTLAMKLQPSVIFVDEIDTFLRTRSREDHELGARVKGMFMSLWDGLHSTVENRITVIGATNRPHDLDEAILRRFSLSFYVGVPNEAQRQQILRVILRNEPISDDLDISMIAKYTDGFTGSDLRSLCQQAARAIIKDFVTQQDSHATKKSYVTRTITTKDFLVVMQHFTRTSESARNYQQEEHPPISREALNHFSKMFNQMWLENEELTQNVEVESKNTILPLD